MNPSPLMLTLCPEEGSILVSKDVFDALGSPRQIQMLLNDVQKKLLLQSCTPTMREAIVVPQGFYLQFEMSGQRLLKKIRKLTHWADNTPRVVYGEYVPELPGVVFDLTQALPAELQDPNGIRW